MMERYSGLKQWLSLFPKWYKHAMGDGPLDASAEEKPFRSELFSIKQLEHHARVLAGMHELAAGGAADRLIARLEENERILVRTYDGLIAALENDRTVVPAAEWLLDNFYLIEEQVRTARRHLPRAYSKSLPRLARGPAAGFPRVYALAMELISHADGRVDYESLSAFVAAYQDVKALTLGELWAIPIMLRLALIENLRRVSARLEAGMRDRMWAAEWADRMVDMVERNPSDLILVMADMARANPPLTSAFVAELTRHLQGQSPHLAFALTWLENRVSEQGLKIAHLVQMESQVQATDQVSIGNTISSLRFLSLTNWPDFVESLSVVEKILREDPVGVYGEMNFATRDMYRHAVEDITKRATVTEIEVARRAVALAREAWAGGPVDRKGHVGFYLIDKGRQNLERAVDARLSWRVRAARLTRRHPLFVYLSGILLVTACVAAWLYPRDGTEDVPPGILALLAVPVLFCVVQFAIGIINWLVTIFVHPKPLPRMDFRKGIPPERRTMVAVPTLLTSRRAVQDLLETIEIHYVANPDDHLHFALLTDLKDASGEVVDGDDALILEIREGIEALNEKYKNGRGDIFFLFHRPRQWNNRDKVWMGYERKRGKLKEFNSVLRGGARDRFQEIVGDVNILTDIRYVITLDTDTELPRDAARGMVEAMSHPLNQPVFDESRQRVVDGYGILQPRAGTSLPSTSKSWYARLFSTDSGLDPYTRVVSDIYQDLFGEGSFIGKGIYEVEAFHRACSCLPENAILSHDLLESAYARSALLSDVEVYENFPCRHPADVSRRCRWIRGDWQILWWLLPWVPGPDRGWVRNPVSLLSKWKIGDNLRRSLTAPAMFALFCAGWFLPWPVLSMKVMLVAVATVAAAPILTGMVGLLRKPIDLPWGMHFRAFGPGLLRNTVQILFALALVPFDAFSQLDAIVRTLGRMMITRRNMLEWTTSSEAEQAARTELAGYFRNMWTGPVAAVIVGAGVALVQPGRLVLYGGFLILWLASPALSWWLSRPFKVREPELSREQKLFLRKLARRTWRYFEVFVTPEENWLPPDNFQEYPVRSLANRTSPTNMGMLLLGNLSAYDFGYCSAERLLERTGRTLDTMERMERYHGHFFNWYDTRSLKVLPPRYISTVDSGNLVVHSSVLRQGLLEMVDACILPAHVFEGIEDTARVLTEVVDGLLHAADAAYEPAMLKDVREKIDGFVKELGTRPKTTGDTVRLLQRLATIGAEFAAGGWPHGELQTWSRCLADCAAEQYEDIASLAPWAVILPAPPGLWNDPECRCTENLEELRTTLQRLDRVPTLREAAGLKEALSPLIEGILASRESHPGVGPEPLDPENTAWLKSFHGAVIQGSRNALVRIRDLELLAERCRELADMDFSFLFDKTRDLFAIGYNAGDHRLDSGYYDLLASEARLASFYAISQGMTPKEHWFAMGRLLTSSRGAPALLSWSGSMFEYLMPLLVMPAYENTLLDQTCKAVVQRQVDYGKQRGVPWGISESGFNAWDSHYDYQYRAFGVPGLGLKRGLAEDLVVAPYATVLALMIAPEAACENLERLDADGRQGHYGFYEAVDYTPLRLPPGVGSVTVRSFMAHHEGMSLLALAYVLLGRPMQRRFQADPAFQATTLLLQERIPRTTGPLFPHAGEAKTTVTATQEAEGIMRILNDPSGPAPEVHLLSNGRYHVVVSSAGGGYSRWRNLAVSRWREDPTRDCWGSFCYIRDTGTGRFWSTAYHPTLTAGSSYEAIFTQGKAEFRRRVEELESHMEIAVSPEDDIELRRVTITNHLDKPRRIEVTSYMEIVLAPQPQDVTHPAFSNLFVRTELLPSRQAILCTRRPRSSVEKTPWMVHLMTVHGEAEPDLSFETDRTRFIGRGGALASPAALSGRGPLSNTEGAVLDPVAAIRYVAVIPPNSEVIIDFVTGVAETREAVTALLDKYHDPRLSDRVFELAWTHSNAELHHLNTVEAEAQLYGRLAGAIVYSSPLYRAGSGILNRNRRGQPGLWSYGISGDIPIVLVRIRDGDKIDIVRQALRAHAYWRMKGLAADLVICNEDDSIYRQELQEAITNLVAVSPDADLLDKPAGVFLLRSEQIAEEERVLLQAVARVVFVDEAGTFREQVERRSRTHMPAGLPRTVQRRVRTTPQQAPWYDLAFYNGIGGFTRDGREYIITLKPGEQTPAPWVNVIANPQFGTVVSESGSVYTWSENSHDFRLTPWHNDPLRGNTGEAIYIVDEETAHMWSPSPQPAPGEGAYVARHGFGYTIFDYEEDGVASELIVYVAMDAPVKFARLKLTNRSDRRRKVSIYAFWELVLGESRNKSLPHVITETDPVTGAIFARNAYAPEYGSRIVFADTNETTHTITGDRTEFLGRNGTPANPACLARTRLSGRTGAGLDPCAAFQVPVELEPGQERIVIFVLGTADSEEQARKLLHKSRGTSGAQQALEGVWDYWSRTLGVVYVETPDQAVNFLANGWLLYQTLSCRMWARTGFYQSGGAYGFRDQLQDAMALLHSEPRLLREHLLRAAARQFKEGDVQHWWHPPVGRGVRTHCSDDYLWLPYAVCRYVQGTGDTGVLDERVPFLDGRLVRPDEDSYYDLPQVSDDVDILYGHCVRAIENGLRFGAHGLPLMGGGDWNDGMNLVGEQGKGESVWLGFFLYDVMTRFADLARRRGDGAFAETCRAESGRLRLFLEDSAWDGEWYRRAYFDNGEPLGAKENLECQIDSIPQSWAVLSRAGDRDRARTAMDSVDRRLVRRDARIVQLFTPPFDTSDLNPGYIKGYIPGVRENGGQYTHAAIWADLAFAEMGDVNRAWEIFALIHPISHGNSPESIKTYKVEPYVVAADVYAAYPHTGRGGWTWYTGAAGWMYRLITESLLGLRLEVDALRFAPCIPADWPSFKIHYRYRETTYHITVQNEGGGRCVKRVQVDGVEQEELILRLVDDRTDHEALVVLE